MNINDKNKNKSEQGNLLPGPKDSWHHQNYNGNGHPCFCHCHPHNRQKHPKRQDKFENNIVTLSFFMGLFL